jgi:hypothetical protein
MKTFKNIYESKSEKDKVEKIIINSPELPDYIKSSAMRLIDILNKKYEKVKQDTENKDDILISNYNDLLETIKFLISILQFDLATRELKS